MHFRWYNGCMNVKEIVYDINKVTEKDFRFDSQYTIYVSHFSDIMGIAQYVVISDSDADGLCSARIWKEYTKTYNSILFLDRTNRDPLALAKTIDPSIPIICLDCGSSVDWSLIPNKVYVIDHHESQLKIDGVTYINPKMNYDDTNHCTSTLLYALFESKYGENKVAIQYCAIGGVADMVPMLGTTWNLVKHGFAIMNESPCDIAKAYPPYKAKYDEVHVGFTLAPLINAPSRIGEIEIAIKAVVYGDTSAIKKLSSLNNKRKTLVKNALSKAIIEEHPKCVIASIDSGGKAISGLIANKLVGQFKKPVMCIDQQNISFRSKTVDVENFVVQESNSIVGGGHKQAAGGILLDIQNVDSIKNKFISYCDLESIGGDIDLYDIFIDGSDIPFVRNQLVDIKPFGQKFFAPIFGGYFVVYQIGKDFTTKSADSGYATFKIKSSHNVYLAKCFDLPTKIELGREYFFIFEIGEKELLIKGIDNE